MKPVNIMVSMHLLLVFLSFLVVAGDRVVVRSSNEAFNAFEARDQLLSEHAWQESLRLQQQIKILESLPLGCVLLQQPFHHYACGNQFYRPFTNNNAKVFVQIDPIEK